MDTLFAANNEACLTAGLAWLRAALAARTPVVSSVATRQKAIWPFGSTPAEWPLALLEGPDLRALRDAYDASLTSQPPPALAELSRRLGLSAFERDMILLTVAPEVDTRMPALFAAAQADTGSKTPTFALGMSILEAPAWDALSPTRPLRSQQLLEVHQVGVTPLLSATLRIDERIAAYVKGLNYLDERIAAHAVAGDAPECLPPSQQDVADALAHWFGADARGVVQLTGSDSASKRDVLANACAQAGRILLAMPAAELPIRQEDIDRFARLWSRESALLPLVLLVEYADVEDGEAGGKAVTERSTRFLQRLVGYVFIDTRHATPDDSHAAALEIHVPSVDEREQCWREGFGRVGVAADDASLRQLAREFKLSASAIGDICRGLFTTGANADAVQQAWHSCVTGTAAGLQSLAQLIEPRARLEDVRLPIHDKAQLERLVAHARQRAAVSSDYGFQAHDHRGLGLAALLHGESGTGKTMAAEAVANALSLSLFRVDLSAVVSKYIGETSKNLRRVFDAAEAGGAVLLFDEADAVFGKRSEVKDSHDRYANIDINYLLTRMENFSGVTLLATNMKHALDPAFLRRLRFIIGFAFPGVAERRAIWSGVFPRSAMLGKLDLDRLSRFALTGGSIFNAALASAHAAACDTAPIGMGHVLEAIRWELQKMGRPLAEHEFLLVDGQSRRATA
ncbi:MAG TPA: ATP-binding protein [Luteibacter sp.]|nr:ATP-binding protein [Luteibacter sp.]